MAKRKAGRGGLKRILAISLLVIASACISPSAEKPRTKVGTKTETTAPKVVRKYDISVDSCEKLAGIERVDCYTELAIQRRDTGVCETLDDEFFKDRCIRHYALRFDPSKCEVYANDKVEGLTCWGEIALEANRTEFCAKLVDEPPLHLESICVFEASVYRFTNNFTEDRMAECEPIPDPSIRRYCEALAAQDAGICADLGEIAWDSASFENKCRDCMGESPIKCKLIPDENAGKLRFSGDL